MYLIRVRDNPETPDYDEAKALYRFVPRQGIAERLDRETGKWVDDASVIDVTGIGGANNFRPIPDDEADRLLAEWLAPAPEQTAVAILSRFVKGIFKKRGGPGSGFYGHEGRPGERGGSAPGEGGLPPIQNSPTSFLVKAELEDAHLPESHYSGLDRIGFVQGTYVQIPRQAGVSEAYGTYNWQSHEIMLASNPQPLDPANASAFGGNIAVYGGATILHEVGHHVHLARLTDEAASEWAAISENGGTATVSAYARTNQGEHFAEAYRAYARGGTYRAALRNREPRAYQFMQSLMRPASPRIAPPGTSVSDAVAAERYRGTP